MDRIIINYVRKALLSGVSMRLQNLVSFHTNILQFRVSLVTLHQSARSFITAILIFMRPFLCNASCLSGNVILGFPVTLKCKKDLSSIRYVLNYYSTSATWTVMWTVLQEHGTRALNSHMEGRTQRILFLGVDVIRYEVQSAGLPQGNDRLYLVHRNCDRPYSRYGCGDKNKLF
jgi:hypothetical protein